MAENNNPKWSNCHFRSIGFPIQGNVLFSSIFLQVENRDFDGSDSAGILKKKEIECVERLPHEIFANSTYRSMDV